MRRVTSVSAEDKDSPSSILEKVVQRWSQTWACWNIGQQASADPIFERSAHSDMDRDRPRPFLLSSLRTTLRPAMKTAGSCDAALQRAPV